MNLRSAIEVQPVGRVESPLTDAAEAPRQPDEGAPPAWLVFEPAVGEALQGLAVGDEIVVLTWFDRARRDVLTTRPRNESRQPCRSPISSFAAQSSRWS